MSDKTEWLDNLKSSRNHVLNNGVEIRNEAARLQGELFVEHMNFLVHSVRRMAKGAKRSFLGFYDAAPRAGAGMKLSFADYGGRL